MLLAFFATRIIVGWSCFICCVHSIGIFASSEEKKTIVLNLLANGEYEEKGWQMLLRHRMEDHRISFACLESFSLQLA